MDRPQTELDFQCQAREFYFYPYALTSTSYSTLGSRTEIMLALFSTASLQFVVEVGVKFYAIESQD